MLAVRSPPAVTHFREAVFWDLEEEEGGHGIPAFTRSGDRPALSIRIAPPHSPAQSLPNPLHPPVSHDLPRS